MPSPSAIVEMPTTIAVRIKTCGSGFEKTPVSFAPLKIGAVPFSTLPIVMYRRNTAAWNSDRPMSFLIRFVLAMTA